MLQQSLFMLNFLNSITSGAALQEKRIKIYLLSCSPSNCNSSFNFIIDFVLQKFTHSKIRLHHFFKKYIFNYLPLLLDHQIQQVNFLQQDHDEWFSFLQDRPFLLQHRSLCKIKDFLFSSWILLGKKITITQRSFRNQIKQTSTTTKFCN